MNLLDKTIVRKDSGVEFIFTAGEEEFYAEKGFENDPIRCSDCLTPRKARIQSQNGYANI